MAAQANNDRVCSTIQSNLQSLFAWYATSLASALFRFATFEVR
jgi:hypothetical protein